MNRARTQFSRTEAVSGTFLRSGFPLLEYRSLIEVGKNFRLKRDRASAPVVEKEKTEFKMFEVYLVSYKVDIGIGKEMRAVRPLKSAARTFLENSFGFLAQCYFFLIVALILAFFLRR